MFAHSNRLARSLFRYPPSCRWVHIAAGTNLISSGTGVALQQARPWHMDGSSNKAVDNAVSMSDLFANRKVAVFGVPAPFTGTCTNAHVPGYKKHADTFKAVGVDEVVCYSYACPYAHFNWANNMKVDLSKISFLADPTGEFAKAFGLTVDYSETSLLERSMRFSMIVDNGTVTSFQIVDDAEGDAELLLSQV